MLQTLENIRTAGLTATFIFLGLLFIAGPVALSEASDSPVITERVATSPAEISSSWSRANYLSAREVEAPVRPETAFDLPSYPAASISARAGDFPVADASAYPARLHGKVFFRVGTTGYQCSGTLVETARGNAVYTAGHCVYDKDTTAFVTDFVFVPGYADGNDPFGAYPATALTTTKGWATKGALSYDIGVAALAGTPAADLGGSRKIAFDLQPRGRAFTVYGYPADPQPTYDGGRLIGCRTRFAGRDTGSPRPIAVSPCLMGHGASGGGWITGGYLNSVTSYIYCESNPRSCGYIYGPYFSDAAKQLYTSETVGGSVRPTFRILKAPPARVTKRKVAFRFSGKGSTPIVYECKLDSKPFQPCDSRTTVSRLRSGKHVLKVRAADQTGHRARGILSKKFRVSLN